MNPMKSFRSASVCTLLMGGIAGSICGQTVHPRSGARPVLAGPELFKETTRVSVDSAGAQANFISLDPSVSSDGRYVAFKSLASNLVVPDPTSGGFDFDVSVHDRATRITTRVSVDSAGEQGNGDSFSASISPDGRFVAFGSLASNLVATDTNEDADVFVHDRARGSPRE